MLQAIHVIDRRRKELGISTAEFCRIAGVVEATYRNMVTGRSMAEPLRTFHPMCRALNLTLDELILLMDEEASPKTVAALNNIAQTPATTQEVDTGFAVLSRTLEKGMLDHRAELSALREHYDRLVASKDAQFERERKGFMWCIRALTALYVALIGALCVASII